MKNPFDGLISGLDMVEEIISKLEYIYIILKKKKEEEEQWWKTNKISKNCRTTTKGATKARWEYQKENKEKKRNRRNICNSND